MKKKYKVTVRAIGRNVWFREDVIEVRTATRIGAAREGVVNQELIPLDVAFDLSAFKDGVR